MKQAVLAVAAAALLATLSAGCSDGTSRAPVEPIARGPHPYILEVIGLMQQTSVRRNEIDWTLFREQVIASAGAPATIPQTYGAIMNAMALLNDPNASYEVRPGGGSFAPIAPCQIPYVPAVDAAFPLGVGYIHVPSFTGSASQAANYMTRVRNEVMRHDREDMTGWIIDLRGNTRGEFWPMLAAIGPVLGEGVTGHFIDADGAAAPWGYDRGAARLLDLTLAELEPYALLDPSPRIAVLMNADVAGPGEALLVAFRGGADTRLFGSGTCGRAMRAERIPLSNGAILTLSTALLGDRSGTPTPPRIAPDEIVPMNEDVVERALAWLRSGE
jgi:carboxyl-terminal processing protease